MGGFVLIARMRNTPNMKNLARSDKMKDKYIKVRFSAAEINRLKEMAKGYGLTVSSMVRWLIEKQRKEDGKNG